MTGRTVTVRSPLTPAAAVAQTNVGRIGNRWHPRHETDGLRPVIVGEVTEDAVRLIVRRANGRNVMQPVLRGRFTAVPGGSELTGSFGLLPAARVLLTIWFGALALMVVAMLVQLDRFPSTAQALGAFGGLFCVGLFGAVLTWLGIRLGRGDERILRAWLELQLKERR